MSSAFDRQVLAMSDQVTRRSGRAATPLSAQDNRDAVAAISTDNEAFVDKLDRALAVADLVIKDLALSEAELRERLAELECDNKLLRETLHVAVDMLHGANGRLARSKETVIRLRNQYRALLARISRKAEAV